MVQVLVILAHQSMGHVPLSLGLHYQQRLGGSIFYYEILSGMMIPIDYMVYTYVIFFSGVAQPPGPTFSPATARTIASHPCPRYTFQPQC